MYKKIIKISAKIIEKSYDTNTSTTKLMNNLKNNVSKILKTDETQSRKTTATELYGFFWKMQNLKSRTYEDQIMILSSLKDAEAAKIIIAQYLKNINSKNIDSLNTQQITVDNPYLILPKNKHLFLDSLYSKAFMEDHLKLFTLLNEHIADKDNINLLIQLNKSLIEDRVNILNYLIKFFNANQINTIFDIRQNPMLASINDKNKKMMIKRFLALNPDEDSKNKMFFNLLELDFDDNVKKLMNMLLQKGVNVNCTDEIGVSPLHRAAMYGTLKQMEYLIENNADVNFRDASSKSSALNFALNSEKKDIFKRVQVLVNAESKLEETAATGATALIHATINNNFEVVELLVNRGANINNRADFKFPPLHIASQFESLKIFNLFLEKKADLNILDHAGNNVLHQAAGYGPVESLVALIAAGLDINVKNADGVTPLHFAINHQNEAAIIYLVEQKANLEALTKIGHTVFQFAATTSSTNVLKSTDVLQFLKMHGAQVNAKDFDGHTALHLATIFEKNENFLTLIKLGVNPEAKTKKGLTAIQLSLVRGYIESFNELKRIGANINIINKDGHNLFHLAVLNNHKKFIKVLVEAELDINAVSKKDNLSPLDVSILSGKIDIFQELILWGAEFKPTNSITKNVIEKSSQEMQQFITRFLMQKEDNVKSPNSPTISNSFLYERPSSLSESNSCDSGYSSPNARRSKQPSTQNTKSKQRTKSRQVTASTNDNSNNRSQHKTSLNKVNPNKGNQRENRQPNNDTQFNLEQVSTSLTKIRREENIAQINLKTNNFLEHRSNQLKAMRTLILNNFTLSEIYVLHRSDLLDHEKGRPAIIINESKDLIAILIGSSIPPNTYTEKNYLSLKLSENDERITYFYDFKFEKKKGVSKIKWITDVKLTPKDKSYIVDLISIRDLEILDKAIKSNIPSIFKNNQLNNITHEDSQSLLSDWENQNLFNIKTEEDTHMKNDNLAPLFS